MAFTVIQVGTTLQLLSSEGVRTTLAIPPGVILVSDRPPRWAVFDRFVILVNTPSQPLLIDAAGVVRLLSPKGPRVSPTLSGVAGGSLSGTYEGVRYTFVTTDALGNLISESAYSAPSGAVTIASQYLKVANLDVSPDQISGRRIYRPTTNGAVLFQWVDLDGNVLREIQDDLSDAALNIVAGPILGTPPHLSHIAEFRGRLLGISDDSPDLLRYTEAGVRWAWPEDNVIGIPVVGSDSVGGTALVPRREAVGVGRLNQLAQLTGSGDETADGNDIDFKMIILSKELGILSQESCAVYRDTAYFLWYDGVYAWNSDGIVCVSDGSADGMGNVRSWFTTDDYFNRSRFPHAFAHIDPIRNKYRLFLSAPGSLIADRWVEFDLKDRTWWGPHTTDLFTPTCVLNVSDSAELVFPVIGSSIADLFREQVARVDGTDTPIDFDVLGRRFDLGEPDLDKYFGMVSLFGKAQTAGVLTVESIVGELHASRVKTQYYNMQKSRESLGRIGHGKHAEIRLQHRVANEPVEVYGYEVDDVHVLGRR